MFSHDFPHAMDRIFFFPTAYGRSATGHESHPGGQRNRNVLGVFRKKLLVDLLGDMMKKCDSNDNNDIHYIYIYIVIIISIE